MGDKNEVLIWYYRQDGAMLKSNLNVQCLIPIVNRQFLHKVERIGTYLVKFIFHERSLQGTIDKFGFDNTNKALVNTKEILHDQAPTKPSITKEGIVLL